MKALCEVIKLEKDIITTSAGSGCASAAEDNGGSQVCPVD